LTVCAGGRGAKRLAAPPLDRSVKHAGDERRGRLVDPGRLRGVQRAGACLADPVGAPAAGLGQRAE
jgi:hypothetical protein